MANKDHSLDGKIIESAKTEFMEKGYDKASMRHIALNAGVTIGAIYTRYPTKDNLFMSIVSPLLSDISASFKNIEKSYSKAAPENSLSMAEAMTIESQAILHLLFDHYELAVLLLCKSKGSSLENFFDIIVDKKIEKTLEFFKASGVLSITSGTLRILVSSQFHMYYQIIQGGYSLEEAKELINAAMIYHSGGWLALLEQQNRKDD